MLSIYKKYSNTLFNLIQIIKTIIYTKLLTIQKNQYQLL